MINQPVVFTSIFKYKSSCSSRSDDFIRINAQQEPAFSRWIRHFICCMCYLLLITTFPVAGFFCVKKIPALERMIVFRLGVLQKVRGPGWVVVFPLVDHTIIVDLQPMTLDLPVQQLLTYDGAILEAAGIRVSYRVCDVIKSVMRVKGPKDAFCELALRSVTNAVGAMDQDDVLGKPNDLEATIIRHLNELTIDWGLEATSVQISHYSVLKEADPRNGISQVVSGLQTALGLKPSQPQALNTVTEGYLSDDSLEKTVSKTLAKTPTLQEGSLLQFHLDSHRFLMCSSQSGCWKVWESAYPCPQAAVSVQIHPHLLLDVLAGRICPTQAYSQIKIQGDSALLLSFVSLVS